MLLERRSETQVFPTWFIHKSYIKDAEIKLLCMSVMHGVQTPDVYLYRWHPPWAKILAFGTGI